MSDNEPKVKIILKLVWNNSPNLYFGIKNRPKLPGDERMDRDVSLNYFLVFGIF